MKSLSEYAYNVYSQNGEDGIIEKIFEIIGVTNKVCVEIGAWDGFYLSNTANLWSKNGWFGILIESDLPKFQQLVSKTGNYHCICINKKVELEGKNIIENILKSETEIWIKQFEELYSCIDLLSIDIDGFDYYIFKSLTWLKPRLVICEFNPYYLRDEIILPESDCYSGRARIGGCSFLALVNLAISKGYTLIAETECNCFFVENKDANLFEEYDV